MDASVNLTISRRNLEAITASNESNITKIIALIKIIELNTRLLQKEVPFPPPIQRFEMLFYKADVKMSLEMWEGMVISWCERQLWARHINFMKYIVTFLPSVLAIA